MADEELMFGDLFATVRVQDLPASREVVAVERQENGTWRVCGSAIANTDGIAELGIEGSKTSRVYAFAIDHWGEPFTPNRSVAYGDIIRPSVFLGWLYRVTAPGVLPGEEPVWWNSTPGMPRPVGSAMAQAEMYFQPIAHGPVDIEWEEKGVGDPHWDKVVSLLHFDRSLVDESSGIWSVVSGDVAFHGGVFGTALQPIGGINLARQSDPSQTDIRGSDFTVEFFIKPEGTGNQTILTNRILAGPGAYPGSLVRLTSGWSILFAHLGQTANLVSSSLPGGVFSHVAICSDSNSRRIYINGVLDVEDTNQSGWVAGQAGPLRIGRYADSDSHFLQSPLDELRITKGVARYTESFTPPTEPFPNFK